MATISITKTYSCSDDCLQSGCPVHKATLEYQSASDSYKFDNGKGFQSSIIYFERGELDTFISLLKELSKDRADSVRT